MAIKYLDGGRITGLSTDTRPANADTGSIFIETDTGTKYVHNGTCWAQQTFDSINAAFGKDKGVAMRTHFVEWFAGKSLNTNVWGKGGDGNETIEMDKGGGVLIQNANNDIYKNAYISTGFSGSRTSAVASDFRPFSHFGSSIIWCERWNSGGGSGGPTTNTWEGGLAQWTRGDAAGNNSCFWVGRTNWTNYKTRAIIANGTQADTESDVPETNDLKTFRLDITSNNDYSGLSGSINGILKTTQAHASGDISTVNMAVIFGQQGTNGSNYLPPNQRVITYCEAWNT